MRDNIYLAWTSFVLFLLNIVLLLTFVIYSFVFSDRIENPDIAILAIGALALLSMIMGLLSFKAPQAKVGGVGGLVLLLLILFIIPVGRETTILPPQPEVSVQAPLGRTGIAKIDTIIDTMLAGNPQAQVQLFQFSSLPCTHADGLGGPPKCHGDEGEGTVIEAFPFLGPEGSHMRRGEMEAWAGIHATNVYTVYLNSEQVYSDEAYPAGEYAIVFLVEESEYFVTAQVRAGKIVRLDYNFGSPTEIDLERLASEIILPPQK